MKRKHLFDLSENELITLLVIFHEIHTANQEGKPIITGGTNPKAAQRFAKTVARLYGRTDQLLRES